MASDAVAAGSSPGVGWLKGSSNLYGEVPGLKVKSLRNLTKAGVTVRCVGGLMCVLLFSCVALSPCPHFRRHLIFCLPSPVYRWSAGCLCPPRSQLEMATLVSCRL
jgi:hypothetical protein